MQKEFRQFLEGAKGKPVTITSSNDLIKQFQIFNDFDFSINSFDCVSVCNIEDENFTTEIYLSSKTQVLIKDSVAIVSNNDNINNNIVITVEDCEVATI